MSRTEMRAGPVQLATLITEARLELDMTLRDREVRWTIASLPVVYGDPAMLRQVINNLVGNAVKYTRKRPVAEIEIGTAGEEDGRVIFCIRDNGAGFDMKYADKLFGVFQRLHHADEFEGTGIGLANVRRIVARHGGRTWAEATLNGGARVYFTLKPVETDSTG